ncbi:hypothetical protein LINGRAHAP2_LOCUS35190 [Linum grandiflorum]
MPSFTTTRKKVATLLTTLRLWTSVISSLITSLWTWAILEMRSRGPMAKPMGTRSKFDSIELSAHLDGEWITRMLRFFMSNGLDQIIGHFPSVFTVTTDRGVIRLDSMLGG